MLELSYAQAAQLHILARMRCKHLGVNDSCSLEQIDGNSKCNQLASIHSISCDHLLYSVLPEYPALCRRIAEHNLKKMRDVSHTLTSRELVRQVPREQ